jgi:hypothetical protein
MPLPKLYLISHDLCPYVQPAIITSIENEIPSKRQSLARSIAAASFHPKSRGC